MDLTLHTLPLQTVDQSHSSWHVNLDEEAEQLHSIGCVHNFEVDEFHTYYVQEMGVWVHNMSYENPAKAAEAATDAVFKEATPVCFAAGTLIHTINGLVPIEKADSSTKCKRLVNVV